MNIQNGDADTHTRKILFLTNAESGQANTILAMALEALTRPHVEVHVASFPVLKRRVERLSPKLNFHPFDGKDMGEVLLQRGLSESDISHPPTRKSYATYGWTLPLVLATWDGESYMRIYDSIVKLINELNPGIVVVDSLFNAGFDACYSMNRKFVMNSPNTPLDVVRKDQPWLKGFWYYPMFGSGIPFPISWKDIPINIMVSLVVIYKVATSPLISEFIKYRNEHGLPGRIPMDGAASRAVHVICPGLRELDYPLVIPDRVGLYGPIVLDTNSVEVVDPELNRWLDKRETVVMCMGTHFHYTESQVKAVINGFLSATNHDSKTQFLWKLSDKAKFEDVIEEELRHPRDKERFKIVDWLEADPASIMKHPNVIAYVHHGGANSYFEVALAGLPQIILAQWYDLYDMAGRAEYLGIGIYGNKNVAPDIEAVEFGAAVARLVGPGKESEGFRTRAKAMGEMCRKSGGKRAAVDKLMEIIDAKE